MKSSIIFGFKLRTKPFCLPLMQNKDRQSDGPVVRSLTMDQYTMVSRYGLRYEPVNLDPQISTELVDKTCAAVAPFEFQVFHPLFLKHTWKHRPKTVYHVLDLVLNKEIVDLVRPTTASQNPPRNRFSVTCKPRGTSSSTSTQDSSFSTRGFE